MFDHLAEGRWWDVGLQIVEGCTKVSPGCNNCWALTAANMRRFNPNPKMMARYEGAVKYNPIPKGGNRTNCKARPDTCNELCPGFPAWTGRVNPQWQDLDKIGNARKPQVYTFWNDLFHEGVEEEFVTSVMLRILTNPQHFYIICTKRPERALEYFNLTYQDFCRPTKGFPDFRPGFKRLMLMATAENQEMADLRLPTLLQIPGVLHGVSVEPGLEVVDLSKWVRPDEIVPDNNPTGWGRNYCGISLAVCGGETGPHARPMHPDIPRKLRDDCVAAGVPFFFKSWGEWAPGSDASVKTICVYDDGRTVEFTKEAILAEEKRSGKPHQEAHPTLMSRVGKKAAGRTLDGRTWEQVPEVKAIMEGE